MIVRAQKGFCRHEDKPGELGLRTGCGLQRLRRAWLRRRGQGGEPWQRPGPDLAVVELATYCLFKWEETGMSRVCPEELSRQESNIQRTSCYQVELR